MNKQGIGRLLRDLNAQWRKERIDLDEDIINREKLDEEGLENLTEVAGNTGFEAYAFCLCF
ncbi:MAG: hypothetical protein ACOCZJ_02945 [Thermoplasmatota archaeon]